MTATFVVLAGVLSFLLRHRPTEAAFALFVPLNASLGILAPWAAALLLSRLPRHPAGWLLFTSGLLGAVHTVLAAAADVRLVAHGLPAVADWAIPMAELPPDVAILAWLMSWIWVPSMVCLLLLPLVFPDGVLPRPGGRAIVGVALGCAALLMTGLAVFNWPTSTWQADDPPPIVGVLMFVGGLCMLAVAVAGTAAFVLRWRRAGPERRRFQVVGGLAIVFVVSTVATLPWLTSTVSMWTAVVTVTALTVAYVLAILRFRLHDIEPVLGRSAVFAVLALFVVGVYFAVVVGIGRLVGAQLDDPVLPLVAVALVALLVEPGRRGLMRLLDRSVYGRRSDPGAVLSTLADQASQRPPAALDDVAELLRRGTAATRAEVRLGDEAVTDPDSASGGELPIVVAPIEHRGARLGELRLYATAAADLAPGAAQLATDVARLLGIVVHDERLAAQLAAQVDELRASRQRLVEAQDRARRELERDIHDGAQARLVALRLRVAALRARVPAADSELADGFDELGGDLEEAIRELRALARGLHPPVLEQAGVAGALRSHVRELRLPVEIVEHGAGRYPRAVEAAAYFCCLEAIRNASAHGGEAIAVTIDSRPDGLTVRVEDDGRGFDPAHRRGGTGLANISDRVGALGGVVRIGSRPGSGTTIEAAIPAEPVAASHSPAR